MRATVIAARCSCVAAAFVAAWWLLWWAAHEPLHASVDALLGRTGQGADSAQLAVYLAAWVCLFALTVLTAGAALTACSALLGERALVVRAVAAIVTPRLFRRVLLAACGVGVSAPLILGGPALADGSGQGCAAHPCVATLEGLALPDLPTGRPWSRSHPGNTVSTVSTASTVSTVSTVITVRPGDSLWRIVRGRLPHASDQRVAREVARLYAANRSIIGPDPDLIFPGTHLHAPEGLP
ncbi:MAG: LysM peptidoglycan-binding domain-containing protein [Nocardioidaceae bacterium]